MFRRRQRPSLLLPFLAVLAPVLLVAGLWLGGHPRYLPGFVADAVIGDREASLVGEAIDQIRDDYYRPIPRSQLVNRSIDGAVRSLDDQFSHYFDPASYRAFENATRGGPERFSGVGMQTSQDRRGLRVEEVIPDSPAKRVGIRGGDVITAVDGRPIAGRPAAFSAGLIKGKPGTMVRLTIVRGRERRVERVRRARIMIKTEVVKSRMLRAGGRRLGYVALKTFSSGAHGLLRREIDRRRREGARGLVLDLRGNGGGLVDEAQLVASIFLPEGPIVTLAGRTKGRRTLDATGGAIPTSVPVVVLVDRGTASAAEIVSGALKVRGRAKLVGDRTFGKGVFQEVSQLPNGGALDLTVGEYFLPNGSNIGNGVKEGAGIRPDIAVPATRTRRGPDRALRVAERTLAAALR